MTLQFLRPELLYDIKNAAYVVADVMGYDMQHATHVLADIGEAGNVDRVTRMLDLAFAHCVEVCYPYSKQPVDADIVKDDKLADTGIYTLVLNVPSDFSKTTVDLLLRLIHELMVCWVLSDWLSIVVPGSESKWKEKLDELDSAVSRSLNARCGRVRRTQSPF